MRESIVQKNEIIKKPQKGEKVNIANEYINCYARHMEKGKEFLMTMKIFKVLETRGTSSQRLREFNL